MTLRILLGLSLVAALMAPRTASGADSVAVPAALQAAVLQKVLSFDRTLGDKAKRILLVYGDASAQKAAAGLAGALKAQGMEAKMVPAADLQGEPAPIAVYLASAVGLEKVQKYCVTMKVLSVAQDLELVKSGHLSVAIAQGREHNVEIWINLNRARTEWQDLAAELLQVARVVN